MPGPRLSVLYKEHDCGATRRWSPEHVPISLRFIYEMHRSIASKQILPAVYNKRCLHDLLPHLFFICISIIVIVARVLLDTVPVGIFDSVFVFK